jgi:hypothetical protein
MRGLAIRQVYPDKRQRTCPKPVGEPQLKGSGPVSESEVVAIESGQLRHAQPGLGRQYQQSAVSATFPATGVGCVDKSVDLGRGEKRDELLVEPFGRDRQDPLDHLGVLGVTQRGEGEQRADGGQPQVAGVRAIAPVVF